MRLQFLAPAVSLLAVRAAFCAVVSIPDHAGQAGQTIAAALSFSAEGQAVSGIQFDIQWDSFLNIQVVEGSGLGPASKTLYSASRSAGMLRVLIAGANQNLLPDGELLKPVIWVASNAQPGTAQVRITNVIAAGPDGQPVPVQAAGFNIQIQPGAAPETLPSASVLNAASFAAGPVSPGEIITIMGLNDPSASEMVFVNGIRAPVLYAGTSQVNAIVPFALNLNAPANIEVLSQGLSLGRTSVPVAPASPAVFTQSASGAGPGAILNQDYSVNSVSNPAPPGSIVMIYGTGFGTLTPAAVDGQIATGLAATTAPVTAMVGGTPADVLYAGAAPGLVAGAVQINVRIPQGAQPNPATPISLRVAGATTPAGVTVAVGGQ